MTVNKNIWSRYISQHIDGQYPCPRCAKGHVLRGDTPVAISEPKHSSRRHSDDEWEPEWVQSSFTTMLTCDNPACGEIVAVSGHGGVESINDYDMDGNPTGTNYSTWLRPRSMFPAPPLFPLSKKYPKAVQEELRLAFQLFWTDLSSSTSRLRTSLERVLDEQGIPTTTLDKNGKLQRLSLFARIDLFEKAANDSDSAESMNALRVVGNLGTHGDEVTEGDFFDLLDVYEDALLDIYEQKKANLKAKKQALIALNSK